MEAASRELRYYRTPDGKEPYWDWFDSLRDRSIQARVLTRVDRLESGNPGDHRSVGGGVLELKLDFGPGYRIYYGEDGHRIVLLLIGGNKKTQRRDIEKAKTYWISYKSGRNKHGE